PISPLYFMVYRLSFAYVFSALGALAMLSLGGLAFPGWTASILLALQYGMVAPLITLILATFANNKIEGMAFFKGVDLALLLPVASFFLPGFWGYLFALVPTFWTFRFYEQSLASGGAYGFYLLGLGVYLGVIILLFQQFRRRVFDR
ncbi:MAG: hypothetical protein AAFP02_07315, partial [Bacteroidota bacterium]